MYGFQINQVVLFGVIWCASFASAYSRSFAVSTHRRRRSHGDRIAYSSTAGFAAVCILGIVSFLVGAEYFDSHGIVWVCIATGIGALGEEQHTLMRSMLLGLLQTLTKKQDDNDK